MMATRIKVLRFGRILTESQGSMLCPKPHPLSSDAEILRIIQNLAARFCEGPIRAKVQLAVRLR